MGKKKSQKKKKASGHPGGRATPRPAGAEEELLTNLTELPALSVEDCEPQQRRVVVQRRTYEGNLQNDLSAHSSDAMRFKMAERFERRLVDTVESANVSTDKLENLADRKICPEIEPFMQQFCKKMSAQMATVPQAGLAKWETSRIKRMKALHAQETNDRDANLANATWEFSKKVQDESKYDIHKGIPPSSATLQYKGTVHWKEHTLVYYFFYRCTVKWQQGGANMGQPEDEGEESWQGFYTIYDKPSCNPEDLIDVPAFQHDVAQYNKRGVCNRAAICYLESISEELMRKHNPPLEAQMELGEYLQEMRDSFNLKKIEEIQQAWTKLREAIVNLLVSWGAEYDTIMDNFTLIWLGNPRFAITPCKNIEISRTRRTGSDKVIKEPVECLKSTGKPAAMPLTDSEFAKMTANDILMYFMELNEQADRTKTFLSPAETQRAIRMLASKEGVSAEHIKPFLASMGL